MPFSCCPRVAVPTPPLETVRVSAKAGLEEEYADVDCVAEVIVDLHRDPAAAEEFRRVKQSEPDLSGGIHHLDSPRHSYYIQDGAYRRYASRLLKDIRAGRLATR